MDTHRGQLPTAPHHSLFGHIAAAAARSAGHPYAFAAALGIITLWLLSGPFARFGDTWPLIITTATPIVAFLMVFLILNSQKRDSVALQTKLDELIRTLKGAHNSLIDLERLDADELEAVRDTYTRLAAEARKQKEAGRSDTARPNVDPLTQAAPDQPKAQIRTTTRQRRATRRHP